MRYGVVSDIHGQPEALEQAVAAMGVVDGILCLGDSISQARFCNRTVGLLRTLGAVTIVGNHEQVFFGGCARQSPRVDPDLADWLGSRPTRAEMILGGRRLLLVHSTPWESGHAYVPPGHREFARFEQQGFDVVLYGHTHQPVSCRLGGTLVVNPGSVGEGRPTDRGFVRSCAVLDLDDMQAEIIDLDD